MKYCRWNLHWIKEPFSFIQDLIHELEAASGPRAREENKKLNE